jgi:hypothetical protein
MQKSKQKSDEEAPDAQFSNQPRDWRKLWTGTLAAFTSMAMLVACDRTVSSLTTANQDDSASSTDTNGFKAEAAAHQQMEDTLAALHKQLGGSNEFFGDGPMLQLTADLAKVDRAKETGRYDEGLIDLGRANIDYGNLSTGLKQLQAAYRILVEFKAPAENRREGAYQLGIANLRLAETDNCCASFAPESCILPFQGAAIHTKRAGSEAAVRYFTEAMELAGDNQVIRMRSQWLLNVAYMTLGDPCSARRMGESFGNPDQFTASQ